MTEEESTKFIKRLTAIAISNILYLRNLFSEDDYKTVKFKGIKLRLLSKRPDISSTNNLIDWLTGCFDAIERKYLKTASLVICSDPEMKHVVEEYILEYSYYKRYSFL